MGPFCEGVATYGLGILVLVRFLARFFFAAAFLFWAGVKAFQTFGQSLAISKLFAFGIFLAVYLGAGTGRMGLR